MILSLVWRNLWRNHRRTLITASSIAFAVLFSTLMQSFQKGAFENLIQNVVGYYSGYVQIHKSGYWKDKLLDNSFVLQDTHIQTINAHSNCIDYVPRLESFILASSGSKSKACFLIGTDPIKENALTHLKNKIILGSYFSHLEPTALIAEGLAQRLQLNVKDTIILFGQGIQGTLAAGKYPVSGIVHLASPEMNNSFVYLPLNACQYLLSAENNLSSIALILKDPQLKNQTVSELKSSLSTDFEIMDWEEMMPEISNHIKADGISFYIFTGVLYLIIGFGFFGTILMMTTERKREFGMLISIGLKKFNLGLILLGESILITLLGVIFGILISIPIVIYFNIHPLMFTGEIAKAYEQFGFEAIIPTVVESSIFMNQSLFILILAFLIGLYPIWHIHKLDPTKALKS